MDTGVIEEDRNLSVAKSVAKEKQEIDVANLSPDAVRAKALSLRGNMNRTAIELAEVLHVVYHKEQWREFGYASFEKYTESELDVGYRSAMTSVNIIAKMKEHGISMKEGKKLGWGKMRELLPHMTSKNVDALLDLAAGQSVRGIKAKLVEEGAITIPDTVETHKFTVDCSSSEASIILDAIDEAKKRLNTESTSSALEYITQEWAMANEGDTSQTSLQSIIKFCKRNYGVTLEIVEEGEDEIETPSGENS